MNSESDAQESLSENVSQIRMSIFRIARRMRNQRADDTLSDAQFAVLAVLHSFGTHTLGELAEREHVSAPSMNRTVNCLEEAGYVAREPDENDRRKVNIALTDEGSGVVRETVRRRDAWLESGFVALTDEEQSTLLEAATIMRKVAGQ